MFYRYETHLHTSEVSTCAASGAEAMVAAFVEAGYTGIIMTDHFITENRNVPDSWPWERKMRFLHSGYEKAAAAGARTGLDVFFAWEMPMPNAEDYLTYNLPLAFLLAHPELPSLDLPAYSALLRDAGGLIVRAHPFRQAHYIPPNPSVISALVDGVEVNNGLRDDPEQNNPLAWSYAREHPGLIRTSGTDIHDVQYAGKAGMAFTRRFANMQALADAMRAQEGYLIIEGQLYDREGKAVPEL